MSAIANTRALETRSFSRAILKEALTQNVFLQSGDTVMVSRAGIVYVSGDVKTPGGYVMNNDENLTVLQALALAQGLNPTSTKNVCIIRRKDGRLQEIPIELKQIMTAKAPDIARENEDVLFVPNSARSPQPAEAWSRSFRSQPVWRSIAGNKNKKDRLDQSGTHEPHGSKSNNRP